MTKTISEQMAKQIGFAGEQILSYLDEITRLSCPRCGETDLTVGIVGKNVVIRCSEALADYNDYEEEARVPGICGYVNVIRKTNTSLPPFIFKVGEDTKRGTKKNSKAPPIRRGRPRSTSG